MTSISPISLWQFTAVICGAFVICFILLLVLAAQLRREKRERKLAIGDSLDRSRSIMRGQIAENFAPLLPGFPFNHKDARFLGQPIDFVVFDGLAEGDGQSEVTVYLVEIKTGQSALSKREQAVRAAISQGRVQWLTLRQDSQGQLIPDLDNA